MINVHSYSLVTPKPKSKPILPFFCYILRLLSKGRLESPDLLMAPKFPVYALDFAPKNFLWPHDYTRRFPKSPSLEYPELSFVVATVDSLSFDRGFLLQREVQPSRYANCRILSSRIILNMNYINVIFVIFYNMIDKPLNIWCTWKTPNLIIRALFDNYKQEFHQTEWFDFVEIHHDLLRVSSHVGCMSTFWSSVYLKIYFQYIMT